MKPFLYRWGPALSLMLIIFILSSRPREELPDLGLWDFLAKKSGHMIGYALLALGMLRGVRGEAPIRLAYYGWAVALTILYALSDEYHQTFVPGRTGMLRDVGIDAAGATIALTLRYWLTRTPLPTPSPNKSEPHRR
jgi:VanZ family protein